MNPLSEARSDHSILVEISRMVRVRDLQTELGPPLDAGEPTEDAAEFLLEHAAEVGHYDPNDRISLVVEGDEPIGWFSLLVPVRWDGSVRDVAQPIEPGAVLSADLSAIEAAELFFTRKQHFFLVLDGSTYTGTLYFASFLDSPFRVSLFALLLGLEESLLSFACQRPLASWNHLRRNRRERLKEQYQQRHGEDPEKDLIGLLDCTTFADRVRIFAKSLTAADDPQNLALAQLKSVLGRAEHIRNFCVHPTVGPYADIEAKLRDDLVPLTRACQTVPAIIRSAVQPAED